MKEIGITGDLEDGVKVKRTKLGKVERKRLIEVKRVRLRGMVGQGLWKEAERTVQVRRIRGQDLRFRRLGCLMLRS